MRTHFLLFVLCLGLGTSAFAQNGQIQGTVGISSDDNPIGIEISLYDKDNIEYKRDADFDGYYLIGGLYTGDYNIVIKKLGYKSYKSSLRLHNGQVLEVSPTLEPDDFYLLNEVVITTTKVYTPHVPICSGLILGAETISKRPSPRLDSGTVMTATALPVKESKTTNTKPLPSTSGLLLQSDFISKHPTRMW